jgi:hypothetical protein
MSPMAEEVVVEPEAQSWSGQPVRSLEQVLWPLEVALVVTMEEEMEVSAGSVWRRAR